MTQITLDEEPSCYVITAEGHATGKPDVCAAISMMMTALANWDVRYGSCDEYASVLEPGYARVRIRKGFAGVKAIWQLATVAFEALADAENILIKKVQNVGKD